MIWKQFALAALLAFSSASALSACANSEGSSTSSSRSEALPASCFNKALSEGSLAARNRNARSHDSMVPSQPDELLLCRYYGFGTDQTPATQARAGQLEAERLLPKLGVVRSVAREFNGLRKVPRGAAYSCPEGDGAVLYAIFHYVSEPVVPVEVRLGGCGFAGNGWARAVFMSPRLRGQLESLVPARS